MANQNSHNIWDSARTCLTSEGCLSIIMPAYGLGGVIERNIEMVYTLLQGHLPFEILPVDDGSRDDTAAALKRAATKDPQRIRPILVKTNVGKGNALKCGFKASRGTHILLLDGDLDLAPTQLPTFFEIMLREQAAIVIGSKRHPDSHIDYPWRRRLASSAYYTLVHLLIGLPVSDTQTGMKLWQREALAYVFERMLVKAFAFDLEILAIAHAQGYKVAEAPITMHFGSKMGCLTWHNTKQVMQDTLAIFYRLRLLRYYESVVVAPPIQQLPKVSVVIACPGASPYLNEAVQALAQQNYRNFEVILLPDAPLAADAIDRAGFDSSHDATSELPSLIIAATGKKRPAEKRNRGIELASGDIVAFLDDDAYPVANWLTQAVKYFTLPEVGGVGGPGVTPPGEPFLGQAGGRVYAHPLVSGNYRYRYLGDRVRACVDDLPSCNLLVRKSVLDTIGGYRTDFWPGEDTILCTDIVYGQQLQIVYDPWITVYHHRRPLFGPHLRQVGRYALHRGHFAKRFPTTSRRASYLLPSLLVLGLVLGAGLAPLHPWLKFLYFSGLAGYGGITLLTSFALNPLMWLVTWLGVMATHVWYGIRFAQGLLARQMPCEAGRLDHPIEKSTQA